MLAMTPDMLEAAAVFPEGAAVALPVAVALPIVALSVVAKAAPTRPRPAKEDITSIAERKALVDNFSGFIPISCGYSGFMEYTIFFRIL
jgi:hypothetical protein